MLRPAHGGSADASNSALMRHDAGRAADIAGVILAGAAALQAVLFAGLLARCMILRPFWDMISWIDAFQQARQRGDPLAYLWLPHNEHHLPVIRLLTALDVTALRASGVPFVIAATGALGATALLVLVALRRGIRQAAPLRALAWLAPMLVLTAAAAVDCGIPINTVYPLALLPIVATLLLFDGEAERHRWTDARRAAALLVAALASMANAVGLVVWPALLWSAWRGGASPRWLLAIVVLGGGYGLLYLHGLPEFGGAEPAAVFFGLPHLRKMADYLLVFLGLPLSRAPALALPARLLGGVLLAAGIIALVREGLSRRPSTPLDRLGTGLVIVALLAALLAAVGRLDLEPEVRVPVRYAVMVAPLHIGLLALLLASLAGRTEQPHRPQRLLGAAVVFAALLLVLQVAGGRAAVAASDGIAATLDRYAAGARDPGMQRVVFPDLAVADRVLAALRQAEPPAN